MKLAFEKRYIVPSLFAVAIILSIVMINVSTSLKKKNAFLKSQRADMTQLVDTYTAVRDSVDSVEKKKSIVKVEGIVEAIDDIFRSIGLNQKLKSVKSAGSWDRKYGTEEQAEVQVEKATMNEVVNIFFRIQNAPMILTISKTTLKPAFDSPTLMNLTMTVSLIKPKQDKK